VDDHSGRVDDAAEARSARRGQFPTQLLVQVARVRPGSYLFTRACENGAGGVDGKRIVDCSGELVDGR
jgi:hypothetical protein